MHWELAINGFFVIEWRSGLHLYSRTWVTLGKDPVLLAGLMASLEMMAINIASESVNTITLQSSRFFFLLEEKHKLLFVLITGAEADETRYRDYLEILSTRFIQIFHSALESGTPLQEAMPMQAFNEFADSLVSGWEQGERTIDKARAMDVLEVFSLFYNVYLQKFLTEKMREEHWDTLQAIFQDNSSGSAPLHGFSLSRQGGVQYDIDDFQTTNYTVLLDSLFKTLGQLINFIRTVITQRSYEALYFAYIIPLIRTERPRLSIYKLIEPLVMQFL